MLKRRPCAPLLRSDDTLIRLGLGGYPEVPPGFDLLPPAEWPEELLRTAGLPEVYAFRPNLRARIERKALRDPGAHVGMAHLFDFHTSWSPGVLHRRFFFRSRLLHWGGPVFPEDDAAFVRLALLARALEKLGLDAGPATKNAAFAMGYTRTFTLSSWELFKQNPRPNSPEDPEVLGRFLAVAGAIPQPSKDFESSPAWRAILAGAHPRRLLPWLRTGQLTVPEYVAQNAAELRGEPKLGVLWRILAVARGTDPAVLDAGLAPYRGEVYYPPGEGPAPDRALEAWWREVGGGPRAVARGRWAKMPPPRE